MKICQKCPFWKSLYIFNFPAPEMICRFAMETTKKDMSFIRSNDSRKYLKTTRHFSDTLYKTTFFLIEMTSLMCKKRHVIFAKKKTAKMTCCLSRLLPLAGSFSTCFDLTQKQLFVYQNRWLQIQNYKKSNN